MMPSRVIRDWTVSERINALTADAEVLFIRLIMKADDYGCYHANRQLLLSILFPLKKDKSIEQISACMDELSKAGLIILYQASDGKEYLQINDFGQRLRNSRHHYPAPSMTNVEENGSEEIFDGKLQTTDSNMQAVSDNRRQRRPEDEDEDDDEEETDSDTEKETERETEGENEKIPPIDFFSKKNKGKNADPHLHLIGDLLKQAINDPLWMKKIAATPEQLQKFNQILASRFITEKTVEDYRSHFISIRAKFPDQFKRKMTREEIYAAARRIDEQNKNSEL